MGIRNNKAVTEGAGVLCALLMAGATQAEEMIPLPGDAFSAPKEKASGNPVLGLADKLIGSSGGIVGSDIPEVLNINSDGGNIGYDQEKRILTYDGGTKGIHVKADTGVDLSVQGVEAHLENKQATVKGPLTLYREDMLVRAAGNGTYQWDKSEITLHGIRAKVNGLIVRGSSIEYKKDAEGKQFVVIHDAYVTTEDVEKPTSWIGTGTLTVYPGDYGRISRLSVADSDHDMAVPIFGWVAFSHSLNPKEGYLPTPGSKSIWGAYMLNKYGILLGNRRTHGLMPTADYVATVHADYRIRRGAAAGLDFENLEKDDKHKIKLETYYAADSDPQISPTVVPRGNQLDGKRYRVALTTDWDITPDADTNSQWKLASNINLLSDRYMLRDFFEDIYRTDDKPDNTVRVTRRTATTQSMLFARFAPNNFYMTDERAEASFYRARTAIGNTGINYETSNSGSFMRQYLPVEQRLLYRAELDNVTDPKVRDYYTRMLNTDSYARFNTTHELNTSFKVLNFLNVTPKVGGGYTGYYDVGGIGTDNRFLGFAACDFDLKLHREYSNFSYKRLGLQGLTHIVHPYTTISHTSISSSNSLVPQVDTWSSAFSNSTSAPMPLDLCGFTGIDGWGSWNIWRFGLQNVLNSKVDGNKVRVFNWNSFLDYNIDNPHSNNKFSNLFTNVQFYPSERLCLSLDAQTPFLENGDDFHQYRLSVAYQPVAWWEGRLGFSSIRNHPVMRDVEQMSLQSNLRINEKYTVGSRWYWDFKYKRMPLQQYSVFRNCGAWYVGATFFLRNNLGKKETGFGLSFTLGETGTAMPVNLY